MKQRPSKFKRVLRRAAIINPTTVGRFQDLFYPHMTGFSEAEIEQVFAALKDSPAKVSLGASKRSWQTYLGVNGLVQDGKGENSKNQADKLVRLAEGLELFHDTDNLPYAVIEQGGHKEIYRLRSKTFRAWLQRTYYEQYGRAASSQATQDALATLEGKALFEGQTSPVSVRSAWHDGKLYLDLANAAWQVIEISGGGWRVLSGSPVRFWRPKGLAPLPIPTKGGDISELKNFVNLSNEHFVLLCAFLVACLCPGIPYPLLVQMAEQGSGKSTLAKMVKALVDPATAPLRSQPKEPRDLMISASNSLLLAFDNLSHVPPWFSDALCRLSTGGGFSTRTLHSDDEETILDAMRPVLLTGITDLATRGDLLDRAIVIEPKRIDDRGRIAEAALWQDFETLRPSLLGALLTAASQGLATRDKVSFDKLPRMADFALWASACGSALGFSADTFMEAYTNNRAGAHETIIEGSPLATLIRSWLKAEGAKFEGTFSQLLDKLKGLATEPKEYPKTAKALANALRTLAPNLRGIGVDVTFLGHTEQGKKVRLEKVGKAQSAQSDSQESERNTVQDDKTNADRALTVQQRQSATVSPQSAHSQPEKHRAGRQNSHIPDRADRADRANPAFSNGLVNKENEDEEDEDVMRI